METCFLLADGIGTFFEGLPVMSNEDKSYLIVSGHLGSSVG